MKTEADEQKIEELLTRSIVHILPSKEVLKRELMSGRRLRIYIGADPTGPDLHLGHATNFILLEKLRLLGHEIIILFGDFTAMIGDPTDKDAARKALSKEEVEVNIQTWETQVGKVVDLKQKENPVKILKNSEWLSQLSLQDTISIAGQFTVQQMVERDMFEKRLNEKKPIYLHEFFYPLLQGYDSVALNVDAEVGGSDQLFNMLAGRTLQKHYNDKEKFVITTTLLENPKTGKKLMSKSEGPCIALSDPPNEMFGKTMALPDEVLVQVFTDCTRVPLSEIEKRKEELAQGANPRDIKLALAREIVRTYHGGDDAAKAEEYFINTFQKKRTPKEALEVLVSAGEKLINVATEKKLVTSRSDFRRLMDEKAVRDEEGRAITDYDYAVLETTTIKIGKRKFLKLIVRE